MASASYPVTQQNLLINTSFDVEQFVIHNTSQYAIYVTISGTIPTIKEYDYLIQANSDFSSALINTRTLNLYTNAFDFTNAASIDLFDTLKTPPSNAAYNTGLSINSVKNFPFALTSSGVLGIALPIIVFDTLTPIYFFFNTDIVCALCVYNATNDQYKIVAMCNTKSGDGIMYYTPSIIGLPVQLYILNIGNPTGVIIYAAYSNTLIYKNNVSQIFPYRIFTPSTFSEYGIIRPPAFGIRITLTKESGAGAINFDVTISLVLSNPINKIDTQIIDNVNYVGVISPLGVGFTTDLYVSNQYLINEYKFLFFNFTCNSLSGAFTVHCEIYNFNS